MWHNKLNWKLNFMPSFHKSTICIKNNQGQEIDKFRVEARPLGFRGTLGLSWLLHLTPYITGSKPKFCIIVKRLSISSIPFQLALKRKWAGHDHLVLKTPIIETKIYHEDFQHDEPISQSGEYSYILQLAEDSYNQAEAELVSFKAKVQEDITMWVFGFVMALLAAGFGSIITWLFTRGHH
jgi:hypothetical protein